MTYDTRYDGTDQSDYYRGTMLSEEIFGLDGDDDLGGGAGDDYIDGGAGNDLLEGKLGDDILIGGEGIDAVVYSRARGEVHVDLSQGFAHDFADRADGQAYGTDTLSGIEVVIGSSFGDSFIGSDAGDDLRGGAGDDYIDAGKGDDVLRGDEGNDVLDGGDGFDFADFFYTDGVIVDLREVYSALSSDGLDQLRAIEGVIGSRSADSITGNDVDNRLIGYARGDVLSGMAGDDTLEGGRGRDVLTGGEGTDRLYGGRGMDRFVFDEADIGATLDTADRIGDFSQKDGDRIDARAIDADTSTRRNDAFVFIGDAAFSGTAGELRYSIVDGQTIIEGDNDGDAIADGLLKLDGEHALVAADFML